MLPDHFDEMIADLEAELARVRAESSLRLVEALDRKIAKLKAMRDIRRAPLAAVIAISV